MRLPVLVCFLTSAAIASSSHAQDWSVAASTGPFIFGSFAERTSTIGNGTGTSTTRSQLSASTRAGGAADVEKSCGRWVSVRFEAAWTRAPLSIKSQSGSEGITIDAGNMNVTTVSLPVVVHINKHAALRFHLMGGPAYSFYRMSQRRGSGTTPLFDGTRGRIGVAAGFGVAWWLSKRAAIEWQAADTVTRSPLHVSDIAATSRGVKILEPHNAHTTIGARYRF
jgi:hypothetical protein